jgi:hypothetical protein
VIPAAHQIPQRVEPDARSECADCVSTPCCCAKRAMYRQAAKHIRLDKLNGELSAAIDRLQKVVDRRES